MVGGRDIWIQGELTAERRPRQSLPPSDLIRGPKDVCAHEFSHVLGKPKEKKGD